MENINITTNLRKLNSDTVFFLKNLLKFTFTIFILFLIYPFSISSALADTNLVKNPSFENGTTTPLYWTFVTNNGNTPFWDTKSHSGTRSVQVKIEGTRNKISGYPKSNLISAQPLTTYTASVWGKTQNAGGSNTPAVRVVELDANKNWISQTNLPVFGRGTNDWTQKTVEFKTAANTRYLYVYANIWKGYGTFWVDEVKLSLKTSTLTPVPTPVPTTTPAPTPVPTPVTTSTPTPTPKQKYSYSIYKTGNIISAINGSTGNIDYSGTNARTVINNAFQNGQTFFISPGTYDLGDLTSSGWPPDVVFDLDTRSDMFISGYGATFIAHTTDTSIPMIFYFHNPNNISIYGLSFNDSGTVLSQTSGAFAYSFVGDIKDNTSKRGVIIKDSHGDNLTGFFRVFNSDNIPTIQRVRNILIENSTTNNTYYGLNFLENGDNVTAIRYLTNNVRRAYFPYGVNNHTIELNASNGPNFIGANSNILIKRYVFNTSNITVNATIYGTNTHSAQVRMEHQNNDGASAIIKDININLRLMNLTDTTHNYNDDTSYVAVNFTSWDPYNPESVTNHKWNNIKISGNFGNIPTNRGIIFGAKQNTPGDLYLSSSLSKFVDVKLAESKGFIIH